MSLIINSCQQSSDLITKKTEHKPIKQSLTVATIIMMSSVLLSRFTGLFREMVLADFGGTSTEMDAYVTSFLVPELLNHFLAGGFLSITFIPIFQRYWSIGETNKAWRSFSNLITLGSIAFIIFIPIIQIFTPSILSLMGNQISDPVQLSLTTKMTRIILPAQLLFYWGAFFSAIQMAQKSFLFPALAPLVYNIGIIAGGMVLGPHIGIEGFAWGVLIGAFAGNVLLQIPGALKCGMKFSFVFAPSDPDFFEYIKKTLPLIAGLSMTFSNEVFFRFFGSYLSAGVTSSVNYALRTMMIVTAVFGQASGTAFYPFLVSLATEKKYSKMTALVNSALKKIALYLIPLSTVMIVLSQQIISLLFERGKFTSSSTTQAASILTFYLTGSFFFSASMIICRLFYAVRNTLFPMLVSSISAILSIPLYIIFSSWFNARGIAIAASVSMFVQFVILVLFWYNKYEQLSNLKNPIIKLFQIVAISVVVAPISILIKNLCLELNITNLLLKNLTVCISSATISILLVFILYEIFKIQHLKILISGLIKRGVRG